MKLDNNHTLEIHVARKDDDGDYSGIYKTVNEFLEQYPDGTADFVFCVIDNTTGETPNDIADAYTNVNDAYTAYCKHLARLEAQTEKNIAKLKDRGVLDISESDGTYKVTYKQPKTPTLSEKGPHLNALLENIIRFIENRD